MGWIHEVLRQGFRETRNLPKHDMMYLSLESSSSESNSVQSQLGLIHFVKKIKIYDQAQDDNTDGRMNRTVAVWTTMITTIDSS